MKEKIRKILKEENGEFEWTNQIDPLQSFEDYFYGNGKKGFFPGSYIKRNIVWWENWIDDVEMAHVTILDDIDELREMVTDLVNPRDGGEKYKLLSNDVYEYTSPSRNLNGKNRLQFVLADIKESYDYFGQFAQDNNLTILEVMDIFKQWLNKRHKEGKPLH